MRKIFYLLFIMFSACSMPSEKDQWVNEPDSIKYSKQREIEVWGHRLLGMNKELYYGTPVKKLAYAIADNNIQVVEQEIESLNDTLLNFQDDKFKMSLTNFAVRHENFAALKCLMEHGANPNLLCKNGGNAFTAALVLNNNYRSDFFEYILNNGGNPNSVEFDDKTILMSASTTSLKTVKQLIQKGADPYFCHYNEERSSVSSPLSIALLHSEIDIVNYYLFECKVDPNTITVYNKTTGTWTIADRANHMFFKKEDTLSHQKKEQLLDTLRTMGFVSRQEQGYSIY